MPLIYLSGAWVAGIWLGSQYNIPPALILIGLIPLSLLLIYRRSYKKIILFSLCLISLFTAAAYAYSSLHKVDDGQLRFYNDRIQC